MKIGNIERVPLREIWENEARDFTPWLEENIDVLSETLGFPLSVISREQGIGAFSVDLLAQDEMNNRVIIENQLEKSDHDHLGKLLTYLTNLDAKKAVWICSDIRPEHEHTISWLNEISPEDISFYLLRIEGVRIRNSPPAPLFTVICRPSQEIKQLGVQKKDYAAREMKLVKFWSELKERSLTKTTLHANVAPYKQNFFLTGAGKTGLMYMYYITNDWGAVDLYIDKGKDSARINKKIFDTLHATKERVEMDFGEELEWSSREGRRSCFIRWKYTEAGLENEEKWHKTQAEMIDAMIKLERALREHISEVII